MYTADRTIDEAELESLVNRLVDDLGAAMSAALVVIGDRLGLYRAMRDGEPVKTERLARRTQTDARYVREWLSNQVAGGYISYDPDHDMFFFTPEQSLALAQDGSPVFIPGAFQCTSAMVKATCIWSSKLALDRQPPNRRPCLPQCSSASDNADGRRDRQRPGGVR